MVGYNGFDIVNYWGNCGDTRMVGYNTKKATTTILLVLNQSICATGMRTIGLQTKPVSFRTSTTTVHNAAVTTCISL